MKDVEAIIKEIIKLSGDDETKYYYGVEYSNDDIAGYKAYIGFSREGVQPIYFSEPTKAKLKKQLQKVLDDGPGLDIYLRYYKSNIEQLELMIRTYQDKIKEYEDTYSKLRAE